MLCLSRGETIMRRKDREITGRENIEPILQACRTCRLAMTAAVRKHLAENPGHFDPRQYLKPAREEMKEMYIEKIKNVLGSNGKAR